jgi:hypothetical protein
MSIDNNEFTIYPKFQIIDFWKCPKIDHIYFFVMGQLKTLFTKTFAQKKAKAWVLNFALLLKLLESPHN